MTNIGNSAFAYCSSLTSVTLPESVTSIGSSAFFDCISLTSVTLPEDVTSIGNSAFAYCSSLTSVTLPEGVTSIGNSAFAYCSSLTSVTLPEGVTSIGNDAFCQCVSLKEVIFEDGCKTVSLGYNAYATSGLQGYGLFSDCPLETLYLGRNVNFETDRSHGYSPFYNKGLTFVFIGDSVTTIRNYQFYNCRKLDSLDIGKNVTVIERCAFNGCSQLESVIMGNRLSSIRESAFVNCENLISITIPESVYDISIEESAFSGCKSLASVNISKNVVSIGNFAFSNCSSLKNVVFEDGCKTLTLGYNNNDRYNQYDGEGLFYDCPLESIHMGRSLSYDTSASCDYSPFYSKETLVSLTIGDSLISINPYLFSKCSGLTSISIPDNVVSVGYSSFEGCSGLTSAIIGSASIGSGAFQNCSKIAELTIGDGVSSIESSAFEGCNEIKSIYAFNPKAITCDESIFSTDAYNNAILYVATDRVFAYEKATPWNKFQIKSMKTFVIIYMVDGKVYETKEVEFGADITLIENPIKEGHTFTGWSEAPETMPAEDIVVYGSFTANKYLVTFKIGDEVIASDSLEYGTVIVLPEVPEKEGFVFSGWGEVPETVPAGDVAYEGNFSVNSYKLTFVVDGEIVEELLVAYGAAVDLIGFPTKDGYSFDGWGEAPETMPANDVEICGTFTINKYLVTFKIGDDVIASDSLEFGAKIVSPEAPEKEGYTFNGWMDVPETVPAGDITIEGKYMANEYLLTFIVDGALYEMRKVRCDEEIAVLKLAERVGYTLVWENWIGRMPAKDYTVRGKYVPNKYVITYIVDGNIVQTDSVAYGTTIVTLEEPVKEGYTFSGWDEVPATMPAQDITIYGTFAINKYMVSFVVDGVVMAANELEYGSAITVPTMPEREGYTFSGWDEVAETVPAHDVTYEACYVANVYRVFYFVGTQLVHTADVAYGEVIPEFVYEPTTEGDVFVGWIGESYDTMPAHDVTYTANIVNGIENSEIINQNSEIIYDLSGRKIEVDDLRELEKGVYVVNGRKVVINNK